MARSGDGRRGRIRLLCGRIQGSSLGAVGVAEDDDRRGRGSGSMVPLGNEMDGSEDGRVDEGVDEEEAEGDG